MEHSHAAPSSKVVSQIQEGTHTQGSCSCAKSTAIEALHTQAVAAASGMHGTGGCTSTELWGS